MSITRHTAGGKLALLLALLLVLSIIGTAPVRAQSSEPGTYVVEADGASSASGDDHYTYQCEALVAPNDPFQDVDWVELWCGPEGNERPEFATGATVVNGGEADFPTRRICWYGWYQVSFSGMGAIGEIARGCKELPPTEGDLIIEANQAAAPEARGSSTAQVHFQGDGGSGYEAIQPVVTRTGGNGDAGQIVADVFRELPDTPNLLGGGGPCLPSAEAGDDCDGEPSPYEDCYLEMSVEWAYQRSQASKDTIHTSDATAQLVCDFQDSSGSVLIFAENDVLDHGVSAVGTLVHHECDASEVGRTGCLEYTDAKWSNTQSRTLSELPVQIVEYGPGVFGGPHVHGLGSTYEYFSEYSLTVELFDEPLQVCASGQVVDPEATIPVAWALGPCNID